MFRAILPLIFALFPSLAWAQTEPPPDTKPARERHRIADKLGPPPEGPWGPEQFGLTWHNPVWRGAFIVAGTYSGANLDANQPRGLATQSDGINPPVFERLKYEEERFRAVSVGAVFDFDSFRLSAAGFSGRFDARATLTYEDGFLPPQPLEIDVNGRVYGFRAGAHWPAIRYRDSLMELSVGPVVTVGWMHQDLERIPGAVLLRRDSVDVLTGSIGPKASIRALIGSFAIEVDAEIAYTAGTISGWTKEFSAGIGWKF